MKKIVYCVVLSLLACNLYANKMSYFSHGLIKSVELDGEVIRFSNQELLRCETSDKIWNNSFRYKLFTEKKMTYLKIYNDSISRVFLALKSDYIMILYDENDTKPFFWGINNLPIEMTSLVKNVSCVSELKEKEKVYEASNLGSLALESPWVENEKDNGIGVRIQFEKMARGVIILSGFISYKHPELYLYNSRPKKILIHFNQSGHDFSFELEDSPNPQLLKLENYETGDGYIEIREVYAGCKYTDTCIFAILNSML